MKPGPLLLCAALCAAALTPFGASAADKPLFETTEDAVRYRKAAFTLMGEHMGRVGAELRAARQNPQKLRTSAEFIAFLSGTPWEAFAADTAAFKGTRASAAIWTERARYDRLAENMRTEAGKLGSAAAGGDVAAIRAQFGSLGQTCKACHDAFKSK
jgi:cytochrome c556